ncbi:general secretion pathway protein GspD [Aeoliella sp. ICT_H6.2]|uniref:General secretion pathway protein GspD n=1 Tax=Aeoliella straminimaris TaxID=2954799 RepID=A0A9X2JEA2_9BACT|nr:general secretion pathway protein GspD [Aeoliella straminimaris]MCO6042431.1 general secretion pathway protein GspD [Aeoliella straminimaris]
MSRIVMLLGLGLVVGIAGQAAAQSTTTSEAAPALSRQDVDALLAQAKQAIGTGDLAQADKLVSRAEQAQVRYPLFHFGDTPNSVRRQLTQAQNAEQSQLDPFPSAGPDVAAPTRMVDTNVMPATAESPYGNYREELPGSLPQLRPTNPVPPMNELEEMAPSAYPATAQPESSPTTLDFVPERNRYANPTGMMQTGPNYLETTQNQPGVTELRIAQVPQPTASTPAAEALPASGAESLLKAGESALRDKDRERALELFQQANANRGDLDEVSRGRLDSHLRMLTAAPQPLDVAPNASPVEPIDTPPASGSSDLDKLEGEQLVLARKLYADVSQVQVDAKKILQKDPKQAIKMLDEMESEVSKSALKDETKRGLLGRIKITRNDVEQYFREHRAELEQDEQNKAILAEIDRRNELELEVQQKIAELVNEFNKLHEDQRYYEMEQVAQRLRELAPNELITQQIWQTAKNLRRHNINGDIGERKEGSYWQAFADVDEASIATTSNGREMVFPKNWEDIAGGRKGRGDRNRHRSEKELQIEASLRKPVMVRYQNEPLATVIDDLSKATGVNMVLDLRGLNQEGVSSDTRVSLNVNDEISLKSALNLILEQLHLSYVIKDEVLKITSEHLKEGEIYTNVYDVADLVIPIPNFVPDNNIGLQGLINSAHAAMGYGAGAFGHGPMSFVNADATEGKVPPTALAQPSMPGGGAGIGAPTNLPIGGGPGGLGGAANADFDSLIDLIISTVASDTWVENGGPEAEIRPFPTNLSLVISQTQDVHEQIADLLEQLRRLQDLQVTIEVRFIRLSDSFFERIGIDFDVNIENNQPPGGTLQPGQAYEGEFPSSVVGLVDGEFPNFTNDLDIPFRQNSFGLAVPTFGTPMDVSSFGFAILSDIEAYFLINASQGDTRSNVLNAPKVTLFNGQQAFVADTSQRPFVISVVPVVGEFAAAQQPVIVVLSEGTLMTIQAVVSEDRRYVRLTVVPFFSEIGDVQEFTFEGTTSTSSSSSTTDDAEGNTLQDDEAEDIIRSGTTVQLPTFQFVSVTTTVSVPDGGTVLLGGIKRLNEGRNEFGVPLLSKVPYINRLFRNVGIGRETDSLMMMVTPRIIIQEEEEAKLLGTAIP